MAAGLQYSGVLTATSSGGAVAFTDRITSVAFNATSVLVINGGSSSQIRVSWTTTSGASTDDFPIKAGESTSITADKGGYGGLSYASTAVSSVELRVLATR